MGEAVAEVQRRAGSALAPHLESVDRQAGHWLVYHDIRQSQRIPPAIERSASPSETSREDEAASTRATGVTRTLSASSMACRTLPLVARASGVP